MSGPEICPECGGKGGGGSYDPSERKWVYTPCPGCEVPDPDCKKPEPEPMSDEERRHRELLMVTAMSATGWVFDKERPDDQYRRAKRMVDYTLNRMKQERGE